MSTPKELLDAYLEGLSRVAPKPPPAPPRGPLYGVAVDNITPLRTRLEQLIKGLPKDFMKAGIPLEFFRLRLRGRRWRHARAEETAAALRALGWRRYRRWATKDASTEPHRSLWFPPNVVIPTERRITR